MIFSIIEAVSTWALRVIDASGYVGIFILSALESCAIPIPSEIVVPFSGFLAATGRFTLIMVIIMATLGNWIGSVILYWIGISGGRWFLEKYGRFIMIQREEMDKTDSWFKEYGDKAIFWSRLLPVVRTFAPLTAGVGRMNFKKFNVYTLVGSAIWNTGLAIVGYKAGENWDFLQPYFHEFGLIIGYVIIALIIWFIIHKLRKRHA